MFDMWSISIRPPVYLKDDNKVLFVKCSVAFFILGFCGFDGHRGLAFVLLKVIS